MSNRTGRDCWKRKMKQRSKHFVLHSTPLCLGWNIPLNMWNNLPALILYSYLPVKIFDNNKSGPDLNCLTSSGPAQDPALHLLHRTLGCWGHTQTKPNLPPKKRSQTGPFIPDKSSNKSWEIFRKLRFAKFIFTALKLCTGHSVWEYLKLITQSIEYFNNYFVLYTICLLIIILVHILLMAAKLFGGSNFVMRLCMWAMMTHSHYVSHYDLWHLWAIMI